MRIIYNPNPAEEIVRICQECKCKFAFTDGDVKTYSYSNDVLGPGHYGYFKKYVLCPNCGKEIIVEEKSSDYRDYYRAMGFESQNLVETSLEELTKGLEIEPEALGPDIEELTLYPHLENPEEDGE